MDTGRKLYTKTHFLTIFSFWLDNISLLSLVPDPLQWWLIFVVRLFTATANYASRWLPSEVENENYLLLFNHHPSSTEAAMSSSSGNCPGILRFVPSVCFFSITDRTRKLCSNPDISGPGVRIALYLQSLLSSSCPTYLSMYEWYYWPHT